MNRPIAPGDTIPIEFTVTDIAGEWLTVRRGSVSFAFRVPVEPSEPDDRLIVSPATEIDLLRSELARVTAERDRAVAVAESAVTHAAAEVAAARSEARADDRPLRAELGALLDVENWLDTDPARALASENGIWKAFVIGQETEGEPGPEIAWGETMIELLASIERI